MQKSTLRPHDEKKFYGESGLTVGVDTTAQGFHTISLEMAPCIKAKEYDWNKKIVAQLMERELPVFIAVLMGWRDTVKWDYRGPNHNKSVQITHQGNGVRVGVCEAGTCFQIQLPDHSVFTLSALALRQLRRNHSGLSDNTVMMLIRNTIGRRCHGNN